MAKKKGKGLKSACWSGYEAIGMKKKGGRMVPNCVPITKKVKKSPAKIAPLLAAAAPMVGKAIAGAVANRAVDAVSKYSPAKAGCGNHKK
tara:strand:- start:20 stop:289 length:270 start_codon:yes stop_codon:yes gene_type:complete